MASPPLHLRPIDVLVSDGPHGALISRKASRLDAFSAYPHRTRVPSGAPGGTTGSPEVRPPRSSRTSGRPARATLMGEQPNPWDLLQPQDVTSRHRGAKPPRRYELLGGISLLSPEYLLSFERRSFHARPPDHYAPVSCLLGMSPSQSSALMPLHSKGRLPIGPRAPLEASVTLLEATTPVKLPAKRCPRNTSALEPGQPKGRISTAAPGTLARPAHSLRPILHVG